MSQQSVVDIQDLRVRFYTYEGIVEALDGVNLSIRKREILGLVGETGCGKSVTSLSLLLLVPTPGKVEGGRLLLSSTEGKVDLMEQDESFMRGVRGKDISMIFQEPRAYLNPVYTVKDQISEVMLVHRTPEFIRKTLATIEAKQGTKVRGQLGTWKKSLEGAEDKYWIALAKKREAQKQKKRAKRLKKSADAKKANLGIQTAKKEIKLAKAEMGKADTPIAKALGSEYTYYRRMLINPRGLLTRFQGKFRRKRAFNEEVEKEVVRVLKSVEIADPGRVANMYPHELSGGMAQRAVIAMALSCNPTLLIADEPTTNLDVTVQAQILNLVRQLKENFDSSILYITHDLGVVAEVCDRVAVMYAGNVVEMAEVHELFKDPIHPYTRALLESIPRPGQNFKSIPGIVPSLVNPPKGCRFNDRCDYAKEVCKKGKPSFVEVKKDHYASCFLYGGPEK